jgi:hypothetical protein
MESKDLSKDTFFWALQGICALHRKPFSIELGHQQLAAPYTVDSFTRAAHAYGFDATYRRHWAVDDRNAKLVWFGGKDIQRAGVAAQFVKSATIAAPVPPCFCVTSRSTRC